MWDFGEDNRGPEMAVVAIVVTSLCFIAVCLRCYTMVMILKRFLIEDWLAVATCVSPIHSAKSRGSTADTPSLSASSGRLLQFCAAWCVTWARSSR